MHRTIKRIVKTCEVGQKTKINNPLSKGLLRANLPAEPLQIVSVNLMGSLQGQKHLLFIIAALEIFSKTVGMLSREQRKKKQY